MYFGLWCSVHVDEISASDGVNCVLRSMVAVKTTLGMRKGMSSSDKSARKQALGLKPTRQEALAAAPSVPGFVRLPALTGQHHFSWTCVSQIRTWSIR